MLTKTMMETDCSPGALGREQRVAEGTGRGGMGKNIRGEFATPESRHAWNSHKLPRGRTHKNTANQSLNVQEAECSVQTLSFAFDKEHEGLLSDTLLVVHELNFHKCKCRQNYRPATLTCNSTPLPMF